MTPESNSPTAVDARIYVVDDDEVSLLVVTKLLRRAGYRSVEGFSSPGLALAAVGAQEPDLIVVDLHMPELDGFALLEAVDRMVAPGTFLPSLVLTADETDEARNRSYRSGACDFVTKPVDAAAFQARVMGLLDTRLLNVQLREARDVGAQPAQTQPPRMLDREIDRLLRALAVCDDETAEVNELMAQTCATLADACGLGSAFASVLRVAARLHDVGKIAVPHHLLDRDRNALSPAEHRLIDEHTTTGAAMLSEYRGHPTMDLAAAIALYHHERWDGLGYPSGIGGDAIPLAARIAACADRYASATGTAEERIAQLRQERSGALDPDLVDALAHVATEELTDRAGGLHS